MWVYSVLMAVLVLSLLSVTTSPVFSNSYTNDSSVYQLLGKYWAKGFLPYVDIWEQKGPFIFFVNAIGYLMTGDRIGVFVIQVVFWAVSTFLTYKTSRLSFAVTPSLLLTTIIIIVAASALQGGDMTEEFVLPFIIASIWLVYRWLARVEKTDEIDHPASYAFVYGLVLGSSAMSRLTNALGICGVVFVIVLILVRRGKWTNLCHNALAYVGGVAVVVLPFVCYFAFHGALGDMLYGTFVFPLSYAAGSENHLNELPVLKGFLLTFFWCYGLLLVALMNLFLKPMRLRSLVWLGASLPLMIWFVQSNGYGHYSLLSAPYMIVIIMELKEAMKCAKFKWIYRGVVIVIALVFAIKFSLTLAGCCELKERPMQDEAAFAQLAKRISTDIMPQTLAGYNVSPNFYLKYDIKPYYKMISEQDRLSQYDKNLRNEIVHTYANGNAPIVVLSLLNERTKAPNALFVKEDLKNNYDSVAVIDEMFIIFKHK